MILRDVQLREYQIHLADRAPGQEVEVELGPLNLDLQNFDSLNKSPFTLKLGDNVSGPWDSVLRTTGTDWSASCATRST